MAGNAIPDSAWEKYSKLIAKGASMRQAASESGISYATVMRQKKDHTSKLNVTLGNTGVKQPAKYDRSKLSPEASRAFDDFGYFRQRYFARTSSPWAVEAAQKILELVYTPQKEYVVINVAPGVGKALALDTPIATPTGWTTQGEIQIGDELFDENGKVCRVTNKSEIFYDHDCYEVLTDDGAWVIANGAHEWSVRLGGHGQYGWEKIPEYAGKTGPKASPDGRHIHTTEFLAKRKGKKAQLQLSSGLDLPDALLPIDPYVLGVWLGDGHSAQGRVTCHPDDTEILERVTSAGYTVEQKGYMLYSVTGSKKWTRDGLTSDLRKAGLLNNKHIPSEYLRASSRQRLALLQGLIDTDGSVADNGAIEFCNTNPNLAYGVQALAISLGVKASITESRAMLYGKDCGPKWRVFFYLQDGAFLTRKRERTRNGVRTPSRYLNFTKVDSVPTQCIEVDSPSHLYLAGRGLMVTHNSTLFVHDIPAWLAVRDRSLRQMIGSSTQKLANGYTARLRNSFERTIPMQADAELYARGMAKDAESTLPRDFGRFKPMGEGLWRREEFALAQPQGTALEGKEASFVSFGMDAKFLGGRFNVVMWDDLVTNDTIKTEDARQTLIKLWEDEAETRLEPGGLLVLQGQRLGNNDLYRYCLDLRDSIEIDVPFDEQPRKYHHIVYKAHYEDKCLGEHEADTPPYPQGCLLDPYRLPWKELMRVKINKQEKYDIIYQQEDTDAASSLVQRAWIDGGVGKDGKFLRGCWDDNRSAGYVPKGVNGYSVITADPSPTKYWAIMWWIFDPDTQEQHLINLERSPMDAPDFLDWNHYDKKFTGLLEDWRIEALEQGRPITHLIVEANAAQRFMMQYDHFRRWMSQHGIQVTAHQTNRNKSDEEYGVQTLAPIYRDGRVRLPGNALDGSRVRMNSLVKEVTAWPNGSTDDCVMAHWFLVWNAPYLFAPDSGKTITFKRPSWMAGRGNRALL